MTKTRKRTAVLWKVPDDELVEVASSCTSLKEVMDRYGLRSTGASYRILRERLEGLGVDYEALAKSGQRHAAGYAHTKNKKPIEFYLVKDKEVSSSLIKSRLFKEGLLTNICYECEQGPEWCGKPLVLQLDHIDGDKRNNELSNLRILCAHCHTQTETFGNKRKRVVHRCSKCKTPVHKLSELCIKCLGASRLGKNTKIDWPPSDELRKRLETTSFTALGKELGVSDNAIRKRLEKH
jgi:hypothetical protein